MKNCITLILLFISLFSFSQCDNDDDNGNKVAICHVDVTNIHYYL